MVTNFCNVFIQLCPMSVQIVFCEFWDLNCNSLISKLQFSCLEIYRCRAANNLWKPAGHDVWKKYYIPLDIYKNLLDINFYKFLINMNYCWEKFLQSLITAEFMLLPIKKVSTAFNPFTFKTFQFIYMFYITATK